MQYEGKHATLKTIVTSNVWQKLWLTENTACERYSHLDILLGPSKTYELKEYLYRILFPEHVERFPDHIIVLMPKWAMFGFQNKRGFMVCPGK